MRSRGLLGRDRRQPFGSAYCFVNDQLRSEADRHDGKRSGVAAPSSMLSNTNPAIAASATITAASNFLPATQFRRSQIQ
jgi:hypothetical protein